MAAAVSTPINRVTRDNLTVLIRNNILDESLEFMSDADAMDTDSPVRSKNLQPISKKLFHSPLSDPSEPASRAPEDRTKKTRKRKLVLLPDASERFKRAYIESEGDGYTEESGMRRKVLISLFHNKEYSMDMSV